MPWGYKGEGYDAFNKMTDFIYCLKTLQLYMYTLHISKVLKYVFNFLARVALDGGKGKNIK